MYKEGIRWTESYYHQLEPTSTDTEFLVLDYILTISMTILQDNYHDHPVTLVMLIIMMLIIMNNDVNHLRSLVTQT